MRTAPLERLLERPAVEQAPPASSAGRPPRLIAWVTSLVALLPICFYLAVALRQLGYPYELEWMEGGAVEMVDRVLHGQALYTPPSIHYVAYTYTPLYFWVSAGVARLTGIGFLPLRLVSLTASLGVLGLLYAIVRRRGGGRVAGLVAAGLFAATFQVGGAWLDIGRVDSLFLLLCLATVRAAQRAWEGGLADGLLVGSLAGGAVLTKQSAMVAVGPLLVVLLVRRRRAGAGAVAATALTAGLPSLVLQLSSHGWYWYAVFTELTHQALRSGAAQRFVVVDVLGKVGLAAGLAGAGLLLGRRPGGRGDRLLWAAVALGFVGTAFLSRLHSGGGRETLLPAYAAIALLAGLGFDGLCRRAARRAFVVRTGLLVLLSLQVAHLLRDPARLLPTAADAAAGGHLIRQIAATPGDVIVLDHPWYATMAGKPAWAQGEAIHDVIRAGPSVARTHLVHSIDATLASGQVRAVYVDGHSLGVFAQPLAAHFHPGGQVFRCQCFFPPTDVPFRPHLRFVADAATPTDRNAAAKRVPGARSATDSASSTSSTSRRPGTTVHR